MSLYKRDSQNYLRLDVKKFNVYRQEHAEEINKYRKDGKECIECERVFDDDYNFQRHVVSLHLCPRPTTTDVQAANPATVPKKIFEVKKKTNGAGKGFECTFCKKRFDRYRQLGGHMSRSHPN